MPSAIAVAALLIVALLAPAAPASDGAASEGCAHPPVPCRDRRIGGDLPLPCTLPLADYERVLYRWMNERRYAELGWERDERVRDTGPFVLGSNYGTHPAVRIYYSPEVSRWLRAGRPLDGLPIGSMIVKEMFNPPAARYETGLADDDTSGEPALADAITSWTVMIKDGQTCDGWFWAGPSRVTRSGKTAREYEDALDATLDSYAYPFSFPASGYGQADCLRCHATADAESTFVDLDNIEDHGLEFRVDDSWRSNLPAEQRPAGGDDEVTLFLNAFHGNSSAVTVTEDDEELLSQPLAAPSPEFTKYFRLGAGAAATAQPFPGQWADRVPAAAAGAEQFLTSDNCMGCHGGLGGAPFGLSMFLQTGAAYGEGYNVSPFGEWRWSPMGLAGRDPAFYSQLATELAILESEFGAEPETLAKAKNAVVNTCLSCHGAMGQRQLLIDVAAGADLDPNFRVDYVYAHDALTRGQEKQPDYAYRKYGNLAREGISCAVCHHIDPPSQWREGMSERRKEEIFLVHSTTGQFPYSPPDELNGPFEDVAVRPMENALGITPRHNAYVQDSRMCGTCHTINLPNVDCPKAGRRADTASCQPFPELDRSARIQAQRLKRDYGVDYAEFLADTFPHSIEQATYLEWKNSAFGDMGSERYQSCQDCHMPRDFRSLDGSIDIPRLTSQIAAIQDTTYPETANRLPAEDVSIPLRDDYRRHELVGLNVFLVEMFDQFDPILGIDETDYMTSATTGDKLAVENMLLQAKHETVRLDVDLVEAAGERLVADVSVESLVGHRFPSGVGFRRMWIQFEVLDSAKGGEVVWASGRTNSVGLIVDGLSDRPLPTEFFRDQRWQPHFDGIPGNGADAAPPVTRQDQVQIYEEVTLNGNDEVTFSFIHRDEHPKDNRLLPAGWRPADAFDGEILQQYMAATEPEGIGGDPDYTRGRTGRDRVRYAITLPQGTDAARATVRVTLNYQAFQPYWLKRKFELSGDDPATQRLYYLASRLNTAGTVIDDWKLPLVTCTKTASRTSSGCAAGGAS